MKATSFSKSKEGRQPVRIAYCMAIGYEAQAKSFTDHFRDITKLVKSLTNKAAKACTAQNLITALAAVAALTAWSAAMVYEAAGSTSALITLAISSITAISALTATYYKKGGEA